MRTDALPKETSHKETSQEKSNAARRATPAPPRGSTALPSQTVVPPPPAAADYLPPVQLALLDDKRITESSGIVASRLNPELFWTHNDSDKQATLYLIDRSGRTQGTWTIPGIKPLDWEGIAIAHASSSNRSAHLYLGDIGDNLARRTSIVVYRIPEPLLAPGEIAASPPSRPAPPQPAARQTAIAEAIRLRYPDGAHDAETLLVHPQTRDIYVITKQPLAPAVVYRARAPLDPDRTTTLERIAALEIPSISGGFLTGGDIAPDGRRVVLCDYVAAYEFILPAEARAFDEVWQALPSVIQLNPRAQGEAICYRLDAQALLTTSEGVRSPLGEVVRASKKR